MNGAVVIGCCSDRRELREIGEEVIGIRELNLLSITRARCDEQLTGVDIIEELSVGVVNSCEDLDFVISSVFSGADFFEVTPLELIVIEINTKGGFSVVELLASSIDIEADVLESAV